MHGGSELTLQLAMLFGKAQETKLAEESSRDDLVHEGCTRIPPWTMSVASGGEGPLTLSPSFLQTPPHDGRPCCSARSSGHHGLQGTPTP